MDDSEDDARYPPNAYGMSSGYNSSNRRKLPVGTSNIILDENIEYPEDDDFDEEEIGSEDDNDDEQNGVQQLEEDDFEDNNEENYIEDEDDEFKENGGQQLDREDDVKDDDEEDDDYGDIHNKHHPKKRKLKSLLSSYEFAPRVSEPYAEDPAAARKPKFGARNSVADWSEHETFVLLDAWGDKFLQHGRKSLRSEEWREVAAKVCEESERTDSQCRNRLDTLKKKYKKEKAKATANKNFTSAWVYFKRMDLLLSSPAQQAGLSSGVNSNEYALTNASANGHDEMDDRGNFNSEDSDELLPKRTNNGKESDNGASVNVLARSIQSFSKIYEKTENNKRLQMLELQKMRMEIYRELELQKRQILKRARAEIAKLHRGEGDDNDLSAEDTSG